MVQSSMFRNTLSGYKGDLPRAAKFEGMRRGQGLKHFLWKFVPNPLAYALLFSSGIVSVAFRFWSILSFSGSLLVVFFTFFDAHEHPLVFLVNASAK